MEAKEYLHNYIGMMKEIQEIIIDYVENEHDQILKFEDLITFLSDHKIKENAHTLKAFFQILSKISNNHNRSHDFINKIFQILNFFKDEIKQNFANEEIFKIFKSNKLILLFLFEEKIIIVNESLCSILQNNKNEKMQYSQFFAPEISSFTKSIPEIYQEDPKLYEKKRKIGENDSYLAELIRNDSIKEFVKFVTKNNFPLDGKIEKSIFETNVFLLKNEDISLIEYAAFYGSIQVFQYLLLNNVILDSKLWLFAIHGKNAELIHILEENQVKPPNECLIESIKCHHINIMKYIIFNLNLNLNDNEIKKNFEVCWRVRNFASLYENEYESELNKIENMFFICCKYDYYDVVQSFLNNYMDIFDVNAVNVF